MAESEKNGPRIFTEEHGSNRIGEDTCQSVALLSGGLGVSTVKTAWYYFAAATEATVMVFSLSVPVTVAF